MHKKVAFISPPPTPGPQLDRALPNAPEPSPPANGAVVKSTVSRFQAKDPRGSTSTAASSKTDVASTLKSTKPASTRVATSPYPGKNFGDGASIHQSLRSGTPYSQVTNASRILAAQSWSEVAEEDLVTHIGQRERTRQEVLWEIVASEERYVNSPSFRTLTSLIFFFFSTRYVIELHKMRETFIEPLLHPYTTTSPITSPTPLDFEDYPRSDTPRESLEHLPIAARFLSPLGFHSDQPSGQIGREEGHPNIDGESLNSAEEEEAEDQLGAAYYSRPKMVGMSTAAKHSHPRSPYGSTAVRNGASKYGTSVPFPSRSHHSLPPPPRNNPMSASTQSLGRQSYIAERDRDNMIEPTSSRATASNNSRVLRKSKKSNPSPAADVAINGAVPPTQLPEDLRKCLEVIEGGILDGHMKLSEGLRKRYEEQYPLVRSLADVFVSNVRCI